MDKHNYHEPDSLAETGLVSNTTTDFWKGNAPEVVAAPQRLEAEEREARESFETARSSMSSQDSDERPRAPTGAIPSTTRSDTETKDWSQRDVKLAPLRSDSAPMMRKRPGIGHSTRTERPQAMKRSTTFQTLKRNMSATHFNQKPQDPYAVNFDTISSESDSSSSSDEETHAKPRRPNETAVEDRVGKGKSAAEDAKSAQTREPGSSSRFKIANEHMKTKGRISKRDGRLNISVNETANSGYVAKALGQSIKHHLDIPRRHKPQRAGHEHTEQEKMTESDRAASIHESLRHTVARPKLNIVIMVIGSRGDIQPFLKVGKVLKNQYGHRVRIATHPAFRDFVQNDAGLEFFNIGGNPSELMAFMVKNPGLIPSFETVKDGEIGRRRDQMAEMFEGFWRACVNSTDDEHDQHNLKLMGDRHPFLADALIANPPSMAHVHIAERLGIPLHMMFTFPYSPTQQFPHPLANVKPKKSNVDESYMNFMSYPLVEMMTFSGLGDLINKFREDTLGLEPVSSLWAPGALYRMKVPYTYMWSPSLVPKPKDWGPEIDIGGFVFLDLASSYKPPQELQDFLDAGDSPIYIGFGSIVVDDPDHFTQMIFKATEMAGVRALVNKGWGGLGGEGNDVPKHIHMLGNTPHDWLFPRVKAVVHHGGAGTTAIGLKLGKPTMIVPFFGDQPFWGAMVAEAKAGAEECIPYKKLNAERLAAGIKQCLTEEAQTNVQRIADSIAKEGDGAVNAVKSFHASLPLKGAKSMRCSILEDRVAVWKLRNSSLRLSALAAELLVEKDKIRWQDLKLLRVYEWNDFDGPGEPITGGATAITSSLYDIGEGVGMVPVRIAQHVKRREEHEKKKQAIATRKEERSKRKAAQAAGNVPEEPAPEVPAEKDYDDSGGRRPTANRGATNTTMGSTISADPKEPLAEEIGHDMGNGLKRSGAALITMPIDLHMAVAQGFHNAPRLYGDSTVRKPIRITGVKSGWEAARKEFGYGVYDGFTGLVTQPVGGWCDEITVPAKFAGLGKGVAKGVGGLVLKNVTAIIAPPAYLATGVRKYVAKRMGGPGTDAYIRKVHIIQGTQDLKALEKDDSTKEKLADTRRAVEDGWRIYRDLWKEAHHFRNASGRGPVGRIKLAREKKKWERNGVLENVGAAERALSARQKGEDLDELFQRRRREVQQAEQPPAPAMDMDETAPEGRGVKVKSATEDEAHTAPNGEESAEQASKAIAKESRKDSEATAVDTDSNRSGEPASGCDSKVTGLSSGAAQLDAAQKTIGKDHVQAQDMLNNGNHQVQV